jgi:hypothetical protein
VDLDDVPEHALEGHHTGCLAQQHQSRPTTIADIVADLESRKMHEGRQSVKPDDSRKVNYTRLIKVYTPLGYWSVRVPDHVFVALRRACLIVTALSDRYVHYEVSN